MNANILIIMGIICGAFSLWALPYGFYLKSIQIESLKVTHALSWEEEMAYKGLVTQIFNELKPHAKVHINDVIKGIDSNKNHKVDISIRSKVEDQEILTIIKTNAGDTPTDIKEIEDFYSIVNDIRASKGIIVNNAGFTPQAKHLAPSYGLELYSIEDAKSKRWKEDIKIPVLYISLRVDLTSEIQLYLEEGDRLFTDPDKQIISIDGGKTITTLPKLFSLLWNDNKIPRIEDKGLVHQIKFDADKVFIMVRDNNWTKADKYILNYRIERDGYLKYFEPSEYRAIKDHLTGQIEPTELAVKIGPFNEVHSWIKVNDIENIIKRTKGYLITATESSEKIKDHFYKSEMSLKKID